MPRRNILNDLRRHVGLRRKVRISRNRPSEALLNGYVLAIGRGLVLLHTFHDFIPHGYAIIRTRDIVQVRRSKYERFWDKMLKGEGLLDGLANPPKIDLSSMSAAIRSAAKCSAFITIRCEDETTKIQDYYFARVVRVTGRAVHTRDVDALGHMKKKTKVVPLDDITMVELHTPYLLTFAKYIDA